MLIRINDVAHGTHVGFSEALTWNAVKFLYGTYTKGLALIIRIRQVPLVINFETEVVI